MEAVMAADRTPYHKVNNLTIGYIGDISLFAPYVSAFFKDFKSECYFFYSFASNAMSVEENLTSET